MPTADRGRDAPMLASLAEQFGELSRVLAEPDGGTRRLDRVVEFAGRAVRRSEGCGVSLRRGTRRPVPFSSSGPVALEVDALQYAAGEGPCLTASATGTVAWSEDLGQDLTWPVFAPRCVSETGVRSMVSFPLGLVGSDQASINFYAREARAFDELDTGVAAIFAPFAAMALQAALDREEVGHLETALRTSRQIGTAVGILMARQQVTSDQAFEALAAASKALNRKLRDIAEEVNRTGILPAAASTGRPAGSSDGAT